jgi:23S rRNA (uracil-5-)-methyltransferase RumA
MHDKLLGCTFEIGPTSFYQTNPAQTEVLYQLALDGIEGCGSLLDAYCGTGTIGICAASHARKNGTALNVVGVEQVSGAVGCARRNARANDLADSCRFVCDDATGWMNSQAHHTFDAVILDPPRAGSTPQFLEGLARLHPTRIVYVSCNPTTQVRDLATLRSAGYRAQSIAPVDMFPHTKHVETVVCLGKKNAKPRD